MKNKKNSTIIVLSIIIVFVLLAAVGWMYFKQSTQINEVPNSLSEVNNQEESSNFKIAEPIVDQMTGTVTNRGATPSITIT